MPSSPIRPELRLTNSWATVTFPPEISIAFGEVSRYTNDLPVPQGPSSIEVVVAFGHGHEAHEASSFPRRSNWPAPGRSSAR